MKLRGVGKYIIDNIQGLNVYSINKLYMTFKDSFRKRKIKMGLVEGFIVSY